MQNEQAPLTERWTETGSFGGAAVHRWIQRCGCAVKAWR
ncbi:hypothetical protein I656_03056 [Geobacillus sp. WSUCF1]|nr:hypothetical protein I656_03056 [Geobacillus sp. WSUCF1]